MKRRVGILTFSEWPTSWASKPGYTGEEWDSVNGGVGYGQPGTRLDDSRTDMKDQLALLDAKGISLIQRGDYTGGHYAYTDAVAQLGLILELLEND
jgi:hypothetical protein